MKIYFKTFGCKVNQYETELLRSRYSGAGCRSVDDPSEADMCIVNTCTVTDEADVKCRQTLKKILKSNAVCTITVTGCLAERAGTELQDLSPRIRIVGQGKKDCIQPPAAARPQTAGGGTVSSFYGHSRAFVKVQDGCDAFCSYCIVPHVRPDVRSRTLGEIISEVRGLLENGHREIVLTGIRLGRFSDGGDAALSELTERVVSLDGDFRVRLSSVEIREIDDRLLYLMRDSDKLCAHLHIPLQSGDDDVLKKMNRPYSVDEFAGRIIRVREILPDVGITTDVIIGYPGETEEQFGNTFELVNRLKLSRLHVFRFSPRAGTPAAAEPQLISAAEVSLRMAVMQTADAILRGQFAERFLGKRCRVLAETTRKGKKQGFTGQYVRTGLPDEAEPGRFVTGILDRIGSGGLVLRP